MAKLSLKAVLKNFLNHYQTLESRRKSNSEDDLYLKEFLAMKELTESLKNDVHYSCSHGLKEVNRRKNRYKDILPYDYSRVILSEYPGVPGSDYINANYIRGSTGSSCAYIASQGPLPNTVVDFWRMIWESEVSVIVMACNETESGKYKCECYWPENAEQEQQYGNITVRIVKWRQVCPDFLVRTLKITCDNKSRRVCQFHYTTWPDHGVPSTVQPILELVRLMRDCESRETRPILVHCSAGCGRTGTICSIDYVWALLRTGRLTEDFSLFNIISDMRRQRIAMVQTQEQYMLCYRAVAALFEQQLKLIDAHTYENLDEDGEPLILSRISAEDGSNRRSLDNESSSENSSDNESRESDKNINVVSPTKDVEQLIGAWQIKNICNSGNSKENEPSSEEPSICDTKQEKLVGKATVIRRPSIAKLKALFENKQAFEPVNSGSSCRNPKVTLQRSFSTRERGSTFMSTEDISIKMNNSFSEPQSFSPQPDRHDIPDSAFIIDDNSASHNFQSTEKNDFSNYWGSQHSSMSLPSEEIGSNNEAASSQSHNKQSYPIRPVFTKWPFSQSRDAESIQVDKAPPKPPRTFQYNNENNNLTDHSSETEYSRSSGGRIIVSVALPKNQERREESHYEYLRAQPRTYNNATHKHFHHEENLYDFPSYHAMRNSSETNIYEPKIQKVSAVCRELSKSSQGLVSKEPIYYEPMSNSNNLAFGSSQQNHFPINLRRDLSVPALPISQSVPPNSHVPNLNVENGNISAPVRQVPQKYVKCDQNRQPPGFIQPSFNKPNTYRYPITYVRPQPNANCKAAPAKARPNKPLSDKVKNESAANDKKTKTETVNREDITKSANHRERENHGKKQGSFASFFGFGKKKKEKSKQIVNTTQQQSTTVSNQVTVRPPHSHRFLPPTQWTQV